MEVEELQLFISVFKVGFLMFKFCLRDIVISSSSLYKLQKYINTNISVFYFFIYFSSASGDEKYIQRSIVPTYHFQASLPRLPIPKLEDTCRRYLDAQKVILSSEEYETTKRLVETFQKQEGQG